MGIQVTLKDVAEHVGVSYQTVWRVVHGKPGVRSETQQRVQAAAEELGFRLNKVAGGLRTARTSTIGLVVPDVSNAYTGKFVSGVESAARQADLCVLLANTGNDPVRERAAVAALMERRIDGIIVHPAAGGDGRMLTEHLPRDLPVVSLNFSLDRAGSVAISYRHTDTAVVARFLAGRGIRRIGGISGSLRSPMFHGRYDGIRAEMSRLGLEIVDDWWRVTEETVDAARQATVAILDRPSPPDAVFTAAYRLTEGALLGLKDLGMRPGRDIELVGFDLSYAALLDPPVPFVEQPAMATGYRAARTLMSMLAGEEVPRLQTVPLEFHDHTGTARG